MSLIEHAKKSIESANTESLVKLLNQLTKAQIEQLASSYRAKSFTVVMNGSWSVESKANLLDMDGNVVLEGFNLERSYHGSLAQLFDANNLHWAGLFTLASNLGGDFDEDSFTPGSMEFKFDGSDNCVVVDMTADCNSEERHYDPADIADESVDIDMCEIEELEGTVTLNSASLDISGIEIEISGHPNLIIDIDDDINHMVCWFVFALLFISSGRTIEELGSDSVYIKDFMEQNFNIIL